MKSHLKSLLVAAIGFSAGAQEPVTLTPQYLESLRTAVRNEHPSVAAAQARIRAADASVRGVRLWEDPMVGASVMAAEKEMRVDEGDLMFGIEQTLPRRKLYDAEKQKMRAERSMAAAELQATAVKLETLVVQTAIELALADEMIAIETNQVGWLERMAVNARERLKDPMGTASEPLRIESELAQGKQKLESNQLMRRRLARQLNILLGRPDDDPWQPVHLAEFAVATPALESEIAKISEANPMLKGLRSASDAARSDIEIAKRESKPIFSVGVDTRIYSGGDFREASVGAKMTIPLFNRRVYRARIERAREQQEAAEHQIAATERELRSEFVMAYTDAENAARQAATFAKEVVPRTEAAAEATQNAWISSKATLLEVLESRRAALMARLDERRQVAALAAAVETLRSIVPPTTNN